MKIKERLTEWKKRLKINLKLVMRVLGFFLIFYAFLIIVDYNSYGLSIPTTVIPFVVLGLLVVGILLVRTKG